MPQTSHSLWLAWNFEPIPLLCLAVLTGAYFYALGPLRRRYRLAETVDQGKVVSFVAGIAALVIALVSPLDFIGMHYLLTAHMVQHVLFSVVAPPLLLLGTPSWMVEPLFRGERARSVGRVLCHPFTAFGLYNLNMWVWHVPALLDATSTSLTVQVWVLVDNALLVAALLVAAFVVLPRLLQLPGLRARDSRLVVSMGALALVLALAAGGALNVAAWPVASRPHNPLHDLMDFTFIATAVIYWMPILGPVPQIPRISPLFGMFYMFISTQPMMALGAIVVFSSRPLYQLYAQAPLLGGFTRLGDQQLAGLIMWLIMDIPLIVTISFLFFRWMNAMERRERLAAGELDDLSYEPVSPPALDLPASGGAEVRSA